MRSELLATCVVLAAIVQSICSAAWVSSPAGAAYAEAFAADSAEQRMFLGAVRCGVWQSTNGGDTWIPGNASLMPGTHFVPWDVHAFDVTADTVIWRCATASADPIQLQSEIWWTFDGGLAWSHFPENLMSGNGGDLLAIDPHRHNVWLHLDYTTAYLSPDYGESWSHLNFPVSAEGQRRSLCFDPVRDSTFYFAGYYQYDETHQQAYGGAWQSTNLGRTWSPLLDLHGLFGLTRADVYGVIRMSNGDFLAILKDTDADWQNGTILISNDQGDNWERIFAGLPDRFNPREVIEDSFQPGTLLVCSAEKHGVYRSQDHGHSWSRCSNGFPPNVAIATDLEQNAFSGTFYASIAGYGVYRSIDHGLSWQPVEPMPPLGSIGYFGAVDSSVFVMNDGFRQWRLDHGSNDWDEVVPPLAPDTLVQMRPVSYCSGDTVVTGLWKRNINGPATDNFQVIHSYNRGLTWNLQPFLSFLPSWFFSVGQAGEQTVFFAFDGASLYRSADLGISWNLASFPPGFRLDRDVIVTDTCMFMAATNLQTMQFGVFRSYDLGDTWQSLNFPGPFVWVNSLLTRVGNELVLIAEHHCWAWSNGHWEQRGSIAIPDTAYNDLLWMIAVPYNDQSILLALTEYANQAWVSADTGHSWEVRAIDLPYADQTFGFEGLSYSAAQRRVWAIAGLGTCYLDPSELSAHGPLRFLPVDFTVLSAYPNPFNSETKITYDLVRPSYVELNVFDLTGRLVRTLSDQMQDAGRHQTRFDASALASGTYFVHLETSDRASVKKLLLLR
jgi:photosystem II stability/assembly factor-like uncharacterized protein